jgi:membrane-bound metal-dependent hydrolase YbcI (DUF457 family)
MPSPIGHSLGGIAAGWLVTIVTSRGDFSGQRCESENNCSESVKGDGFEGNKSPVLQRRKKKKRRKFLAKCFGGLWSEVTFFSLLAVAPDFDLLVGKHSTYTHSVGAITLVGVLIYGLNNQKKGQALSAMMAYGSHILLDWLGTDTSAPIGIMALWPLTNKFYQSQLFWFMAISRHFRASNFLSHNLYAVLRELVLLGPLLVMIGVYRFRNQTTSACSRSKSE